MNIFKRFKIRNLTLALLAAFALVLASGGARVLAHGGEDHGAAKPKTETTGGGTVSHTARVGDLEVMLKHQILTTDAAATARLFVTGFETNEAFADVVPTIEIESATGAATQATVEKLETAGTFTIKLPPLAEGTYLIRAKLAHGGETDTAAFSGVQVQNAAAAAAANSGSWTQTVLSAFLFLVALALFGGLIYFAARVIKNKPLREEAASA